MMLISSSSICRQNRLEPQTLQNPRSASGEERYQRRAPLSEMVRSALEWEAACLLESDPDPSLNQDATIIDYPPTDPHCL